MHSNKSIAIIILNYNTWQDSIEEAVLVNSVCGIKPEHIYIVDNCSPNNSYQKLVENANGRYQVIRSDNNGGYASGNNLGLRYAYEKQYEYAWILNNDIIIKDSNLVEKMLDVFSKDKSVAVVNPDIYAPDGHMFNRDSSRPSFWDFTFGMLQYRKKGRIINDLGGYAYVYRPQGCCMMVDLKKMHQINYMDEHTFLYCEEVILAERLLKENYRCAVAVGTSIVHNHSKTVKAHIQKRQIHKIQLDSFKYYLKVYRKYGQIKSNICTIFYQLKLWALGD